MTDDEPKIFRKFLDQYLPGGAAHMDDADLAVIQQLLALVGNPKAAAPLLAQIDALLEAQDEGSDARLCDGSVGVKFASAAEARAFLSEFRALLIEGPTGGRRKTAKSGRRSRPRGQVPDSSPPPFQT